MAGTPWAQRLRQPSWRDPRLLIGLLMISAAIAGTWRLVDVAGDTITVYAASTALVQGQPVRAADLRRIEVKLPENASRYVSASSADWPDGVVALRGVAEGELIPRAAVGAADQLAGRSMALRVDGALPTNVAAGSRVDVWAAGADDGGSDDDSAAPSRVVEAAPVISVDVDSGLGAGGSARIELFIRNEDLPKVVGLVASDATLAVVALPQQPPSPPAGR